MRVALVTETFPPEINGVAMTLEKLALGLRKLNNEVEVVRPRQPTDPGEDRPFDETLVRGLPLPGYEGLRMGLPVLATIDRAWLRKRPDVVYLATEGPLGVAALLVARVRGIAVVSGYHTNFQQYMKHYRLRWMQEVMASYLRIVHNATRRTFGPSEDLLDSLVGMGFRNLRLLGRGVDTALFDPARRDPELRQSWGAAEHSPVFIYVGRIATEKNLSLLLRSWDVLRAKDPSARMVLVGDGPERGALEASRPELLFAGLRRGEDLARHYASGDVFLFPSVTETFGNVVTEALSSGLLVVAYDYAAPRKYIVDGENGYIVPFNDDAGYLNRVESLLDGRAGWPTLREAARRSGLSLSWEAILNRFAADLEEVVQESRY